jgi:DNA polymerase III sliding clamp (beta) subunit (PCNA family)
MKKMANLVKKKKKSTKKETSLKKSKGKIYQKSKTLKILTAIKPGLAIKDIVEGMKNFYFNKKFVVTYNDKISILYPFKTDFEAFINADTLYKLLSKLPTEDFKMKHVKDNVLIKAKGLNVKLPAIIDSEIINRIKLVNKGVKKIEWKELPENFLESINLCSFAASQTDVDTTLSCVKLEDKICVASDSKRIAFSKLTNKIDLMFIKASEVKHLIGINPTHYGNTKGWLYFTNTDGCIFAMRKIEGAFPNWEHLFDFKGSKVDLPKELLNGVDLASIFTEGGNKPYLAIKIENNLCTLIVKTESGKLIYSAPIDYKNEPIDFIINPDFLKEMMKFSTSITFTEGRAKLETESFSVLTALYSKEDDV